MVCFVGESCKRLGDEGTLASLGITTELLRVTSRHRVCSPFWFPTCSNEKCPSSLERPSPLQVSTAEGSAVPGEAGGRLEAIFEPGGPVPVLFDLTKKEAKLDEDKGTDFRSPLLQALVQVSPTSRPSWIGCN